MPNRGQGRRRFRRRGRRPGPHRNRTRRGASLAALGSWRRCRRGRPLRWSGRRRHRDPEVRARLRIGFAGIRVGQIAVATTRGRGLGLRLGRLGWWRRRRLRRGSAQPHSAAGIGRCFPRRSGDGHRARRAVACNRRFGRRGRRLGFGRGRRWAADGHGWPGRPGCGLLGFGRSGWSRGWSRRGRGWAADGHGWPGRWGRRFGGSGFGLGRYLGLGHYVGLGRCCRFSNRFGLGHYLGRDRRRLRGELRKCGWRWRRWTADRHRWQRRLGARSGGSGRRRGRCLRRFKVGPRRRRRWPADRHRRRGRGRRRRNRWRRRRNRLRPVDRRGGVAVAGRFAVADRWRGERRIRVEESLAGVVVRRIGILGRPKELVIVGRHENLSEARQMREAREGARSPRWVELAQSRASRFYAYRDVSYANNPVTLPSVDCMAWLASLIVRARFCRELLSSWAVPSHFC